MTKIRSVLIAIQLVTIATSSFIYARFPFSITGGASYFLAIVIVSVLSKSYLLTLLMAVFHIFFLLLFFHAMDSIQSSVGGTMTYMILPPQTLILYSLVYFAVWLRRQRP
jgi:hypothetical protein